MTNKKHSPRRESGTPPRRGIVKFIPPLRGDSGGVYLTFLIIFHSFWYFQDKLEKLRRMRR
jgi:hypothetical protein